MTGALEKIKVSHGGMILKTYIMKENDNECSFAKKLNHTGQELSQAFSASSEFTYLLNFSKGGTEKEESCPV